MEQNGIRKTYGAVYTNAIIELVADETHEDRLKLLVWREGQSYIEPRVRLDIGSKSSSETELQTITFEPEQLDPTFRRAIRFPSHSDPFGSSRQLLDELCGLIKRFTVLEDDYVSLAAHAARASWFPEAPYSPIALAISGPPSPQRQQLFRLLSCLYRRALVLGEINLSSLCSLPMAFSPSLFIERDDHSPQLQKVIRATQTHGYIPLKSKLVRTRCATVICNQEPLNGRIHDSNAIEIPVSQTRIPLPVLTEAVQNAIADEFQPKLLTYRLAKHAQVMNSTFDAAPLISSVSELARSLGACVVDDPDRQADIIRVLKDRDEQVSEDYSWDPRVTVLEVLLLFCHKRQKEKVHALEIADIASSMLKERGESLGISERTVGNKLRYWGFTPVRLDSSGRGLWLTSKIRKQIHKLAWDNKIALLGGWQKQCGDCRNLRPELDLEGKQGQAKT